jgi:Cu2+-exporting ATPase
MEKANSKSIGRNNAARNPDHESWPAPAFRYTRGEHSAIGQIDRASHGQHIDHAAHTSHEKHVGHSAEMFRRKFWGSLLLSIPTLASAPVVHRLFGQHAFDGEVLSRWVPAVFGILLFTYGGLVFIKGAIAELTERLPGMMTLISLAISVAFGFSLAVTFGFPGTDLWWELATLITIMLLGHWIEMRSISQAHGSLKELARLLPDTAVRIAGEHSEIVGIADLRVGDLVLIRPGARIPVDGVVRDGSSEVNESIITGESRSVPKAMDSKVIAGTVNGSGSLRIEVTGTGEKTALAGIMRLVAQAQSSRSRAQALADRAAFFLTITAIFAAVVTLVGWLFAGKDGSFVVQRTVTVLVIACPHALGLTIPLVIAISTTLGVRSGLLVRDRRGLENARRLTTVFFDKTGTLTRGEFRVVEITTSHGLSDNETLRLAAAMERDSEHAIGQGLFKSAEERGLAIPPATDFQSMPGLGVQAVVDGKTLLIGGPALLRRLNADLDPELRSAVDRATERGQATITMFDKTTPLAVLAVADAVREESGDAVERLHQQGIEVVLITGDTQEVANSVAEGLKIDAVFAEVLPDQKATKLREFQRRGNLVAMVGDGVNDAPALVTADVGIAMGAGTEVAVEAGDVVLVRSDPRDVSRIIALSRATYRKMIQNLWWAAGYNIVAIPVAAGVLAPWGIVLPPAAGAALMTLSTIIVAVNAQLLRRVQL